jgi:hypothetical protein
MHLSSNSITQVLTTPEERQYKKRVSLTSREALQYLLADWGFVERLTLKAASSSRPREETLAGLRKRLLDSELGSTNETGKLIGLLNAAKQESIAHLTITITKAAALQLRGKIHRDVVPGGAKLCFASEPSGHITLGVTFIEAGSGGSDKA